MGNGLLRACCWFRALLLKVSVGSVVVAGTSLSGRRNDGTARAPRVTAYYGQLSRLVAKIHGAIAACTIRTGANNCVQVMGRLPGGGEATIREQKYLFDDTVGHLDLGGNGLGSVEVKEVATFLVSQEGNVGKERIPL